jgi:IMP dehydrogenase
MRIVQEALTFDDVLLLPAHSTVLPRDVSLETQLTREITMKIPLLSAAMDTVTESRLAITLAQEGGIGIIHKNLTPEEQAAEVQRVKKFESGVIKDPITVAPTATIREVTELTRVNNISGVPVVDGDDLVGIVTSRDRRFESNLNKPVSSVMTPRDRLVTVQEGASKEEVIALLHKHRIERVLVINDNFKLRGMITVKDIQKSTDFPNACKDEQGRLRVGAAVGTGGNTEHRIEALVHAGVDVMIVDTAHGHSQGVLDRVRWVKQHYPDMQVIGGNIATAAAARALVDAGADGVKVGIGPGSICTTRIVSGIGVPQITAVANVADELRKDGIPLIADGGIRFSGDMAKAYRGMGSLGAMKEGSSDRYFQEGGEHEKLVPEGIEGRVPYKGTMLTILHQLMGGVRASMGYTGCGSIEEMRTRPEFIRVTSAGMRESHVHDVSITKEAPNYRID